VSVQFLIGTSAQYRLYVPCY